MTTRRPRFSGIGGVATGRLSTPEALGVRVCGLGVTVINETKCASNSATILSAYAEQQVKAGDYTVVVQLQEPANVRGYLNCVATSRRRGGTDGRAR